MMSLVGALAGSTAILVTWIVAVLDFIGVGLLRPRGFGVKEISARRLLLAVWMGLTAVILFLRMMSFVLPVRGPTLAVVAAGGLPGWLQNRTTVRQSLAAAHAPAWRLKLVALRLFAAG